MSGVVTQRHCLIGYSLIVLGLIAITGCDSGMQSRPSDGGPGDSGLGDGGASDATTDGPDATACGSDWGPWQTVVKLDDANCTARPVTECPGSPDASAQGPGTKLAEIALQTCQLPSYHYVRVDFVAGCPSVLSMKTPGAAPASALVDCLTTALSNQRWSCAVDQPCEMFEHDTLP